MPMCGECMAKAKRIREETDRVPKAADLAPEGFWSEGMDREDDPSRCDFCGAEVTPAGAGGEGRERDRDGGSRFRIDDDAELR